MTTSKFSEGSKVELYRDHQNKKGYFGEGVLIRLLSQGLPYMIDDKTDQYFVSHLWSIQVLNSNHYTKGQRIQLRIREPYYNNKVEDKEDDEEETKNDSYNAINDNFIEFDGVESF